MKSQKIKPYLADVSKIVVEKVAQHYATEGNMEELEDKEFFLILKNLIFSVINLMKKLWKHYLLYYFMIFTLLLMGCSSNQTQVEIGTYDSEIYTQKDIEDAIQVIMDEFNSSKWKGCTLKKISYAGDDKSKGYEHYIERYNADEAIVLISEFDVDSSGGDGSFSPNSTYGGWLWILVRKTGDKWIHVGHGY